ncbi:hypothetical protein CYMTET_36717 [Cymbomonas tetramitiformis]|uniref:Reverse transcriptase domain-containing protein n=1 Tax=Cymbomonas tetramitiformis TaxID=36881 RepID=A0AAE0CHM1_9CHLO|nr:hypothetical protein CYMTET_36717 [Cymbomonas tetramitiformis]
MKDAYALLRPGVFMVKVDLEGAYRSLPVASQYWKAQCFGWNNVRYMDTRSPFSNRALPGIFMRYTRAIVGWMHAQGVPCVGYLDDFFMVARTEAEAQEFMDLLIEFVLMLDFKVNRAKCESPARKKLESLLGLLAFCSHVVWGLSLYTRQGFAMVAETTRVTVGTGVQLNLKAVERVIRLYDGRKVVLHKEDVYEDAFATDASKTKGMGGHCERDYFLVEKFWGPLEYLPPLRRIFYLCVCHDIRLRPRYIKLKDNKLADSLSRLRLSEFYLQREVSIREVRWRQDRDDWQFSPVLFAEMDEEFGPFTLDACVAGSRANAFCSRI